MPSRILSGTVVSNKCDKTIVVEVSRKVMHPIYKKYIKRTKRYSAHDEQNSCNVGDAVRIKEVKPISKRKTWILATEQA